MHSYSFCAETLTTDWLVHPSSLASPPCSFKVVWTLLLLVLVRMLLFGCRQCSRRYTAQFARRDKRLGIMLNVSDTVNFTIAQHQMAEIPGAWPWLEILKQGINEVEMWQGQEWVVFMWSLSRKSNNSVVLNANASSKTPWCTSPGRRLFGLVVISVVAELTGCKFVWSKCKEMSVLSRSVYTVYK